MRKPKKPKPSFDVASADLGDSHAGWVYRSDGAPPDRPDAPAPPPASRAVPPPTAPRPSDWIETGVGVMVLPLTIAIVAMIAPVLWMLGARSQR